MDRKGFVLARPRYDTPECCPAAHPAAPNTAQNDVGFERLRPPRTGDMRSSDRRTGCRYVPGTAAGRRVPATSCMGFREVDRRAPRPGRVSDAATTGEVRLTTNGEAQTHGSLADACRELGVHRIPRVACEVLVLALRPRALISESARPLYCEARSTSRRNAEAVWLGFRRWVEGAPASAWGYGYGAQKGKITETGARAADRNDLAAPRPERTRSSPTSCSYGSSTAALWDPLWGSIPITNTSTSSLIAQWERRGGQS